MAIKFGNTQDLGGAIKAMCYAPAGFGKTKMCATAPSPLIISAEQGLLSLKKYNIPYLEILTMQDFRDAYAFVSQSKEANNFATICIDSASDIAESALSEFKKTNKDPRQAYGQVADEMMIELKRWRHLATKHVYITCKQEMVPISESAAQFAPSMPGKVLPQQMPYWGDELFALRIIPDDQGVQGRWLQTQPDIQYYAKDRSDELDYFEKPDLTNLFNKIQGK